MSTYTPIASQTLGSSASSVNFTNIPQNFTDLIIVGSGAASAQIDLNFTFNSDTGSNYSRTYMLGTGSSTISGRDLNGTSVAVGSLNTGQSNFIVNINNYSNTATNKTILQRANQPQAVVNTIVGLYRSTSAITSITMTAAGGTISSGSTFNLYGVQSGNILATKATGGNIIVSDGTYWYHAFTSSGTFTSTQSLTVDYLVVAGGGGAGYNIGGAGGAGGLRSTVGATGGGGSLESPLSLSASEYTVIVGAGGARSNIGNGNNGNNSVFSTITSTGGGGGGAPWGTGAIGTAANSGGSGGGGGGNFQGTGPGGAGTANQGFAGGSTTLAGNPPKPTSGGGGAGAAGGNGNGSTGLPGSGGNGVQITAFATPTGTGANNGYYAGGGGGATDNQAGAAGGLGGGGTGGRRNTSNATPGTANTGGGGGGEGQAGPPGEGANGGSGIVIIRYAV